MVYNSIVWAILYRRTTMKITKEQLETEYVKNQLSSRQVASKFNMSPTHVKRLVRKYGLKIHSSTHNHKVIDPIIVQQMLNDGNNYRQIAKHFNVNPKSVTTIVNQHCLSILTKPIIDTPKEKWTPTHDLSGLKTEKLTVVKYIGKSLWECMCDCGNICYVKTTHLRANQKSCGCIKAQTAQLSVAWKGTKHISLQHYNKILYRASLRSHACDIDIEFLDNLFIKQNMSCALSGVKLDLKTMSLDRIDSSIGYIKTNVQWVHKDVNGMKMEMGQLKFIEWCKLIAKMN